jgi:transcriptional regulator with XRE-family HTH domain
LVREIGLLFRVERERRSLRQQDVAELAGLRQQHVSRFEGGRRAASLPMVERLFGALGVQLRVEVEALDAHLDAEIAKVRAELARWRTAWGGQAAWFCQFRPGVPLVADGPLAALMHGVPVKVTALEFAVTRADLDALAEMLQSLPNTLRKDARFGDFRSYDRDPRRPGPLCWLTPHGEVKIRVLPVMPPPIAMGVADTVLSVLPLPAVAAAFPAVSRVMARAG